MKRAWIEYGVMMLVGSLLSFGGYNPLFALTTALYSHINYTGITAFQTFALWVGLQILPTIVWYAAVFLAVTLALRLAFNQPVNRRLLVAAGLWMAAFIAGLYGVFYILEHYQWFLNALSSQRDIVNVAYRLLFAAAFPLSLWAASRLTRPKAPHKVQ